MHMQHAVHTKLCKQQVKSSETHSSTEGDCGGGSLVHASIGWATDPNVMSTRLAHASMVNVLWSRRTIVLRP
jgi:hypothetical protein